MKDPRVPLAHILECCDAILRYCAAGEDAFRQSDLTQDAVLHRLIIIGEAVKRLPESYRHEHPELPWRAMAGLRDVLVHLYDRVDLKVVWRVVEVDIPVVRQQIGAFLPPLDELEAELAGEATHEELP